MRMIRSSNPVLRSAMNHAEASVNAITYTGVAIRTLFLVAITGGVGVYFFQKTLSVLSGSASFNYGLLIGAIIVGFISVIVGSWSVKLSPYFSILYAASEGVVLGTVSALYSTLYSGIIPTAIATTVVILFVMMLLYSTGIIKVTRGFASFLVIALIGVILMSLLSLIFPFGSSFYYIIVIASALLSTLFLFLDFANIKSLVESGADASYGWIMALGLMVTLVWIYIEVLRILAIVGGRRN